jgi:hypothetical protein
MIIALLLLILSFPVFGDELKVQLIERSNLADEDSFQVGSWEGVQVSYHEDSVYIFGSVEESSIFPNGYHAFDYTMIGVGIGSTMRFNKRIRAFGQVGLYKITNSWGGRKRQPSEAMEYYLNRKWYGLREWDSTDGNVEWLAFDEYRVKNSDAIGGTFGIEMDFYQSDSISIGGSMSYRLLKINEKIAGFRDEWTEDRGPGHYWTTSQRRNYSSINLGLILSKAF